MVIKADEFNFQKLPIDPERMMPDVKIREIHSSTVLSASFRKSFIFCLMFYTAKVNLQTLVMI